MGGDATLRAVRPGADRRAATALVLVPIIAGVSCVPRMLRTDQLERRLVRALGSQLAVEGIRVACPRSVEVHEGDVFECVATAPDGDALRIRVTQVDGHGGVTWSTPGLAG
jgi:hypothetical protein